MYVVRHARYAVHINVLLYYISHHQQCRTIRLYGYAESEACILYDYGFYRFWNNERVIYGDTYRLTRLMKDN